MYALKLAGTKVVDTSGINQLYNLCCDYVKSTFGYLGLHKDQPRLCKYIELNLSYTKPCSLPPLANVNWSAFPECFLLTM